jgi:hypothetical protein
MKKSNFHRMGNFSQRMKSGTTFEVLKKIFDWGEGNAEVLVCGYSCKLYNPGANPNIYSRNKQTSLLGAS